MQNLPATPGPQSPARPLPISFEADCWVVVGSGPAGVACARALLDRGKKVQMLDSGLSLEPDRLGLVQQLKSSRPEAWNAADVTAFKSGMEAGMSGLPQKLVYGSDFAYRGAEEHLRVFYANVGLRPSLAKGGLSNVWGAAMLPFREQDIDAWPLSRASLDPHYRAVLQFTGLAARHDSLESLFPLFTDNFTELRLSRQAQQLLDRMAANQNELAAAGIHFGHSRLAVRGARPDANSGCVYCRLCMYGCPYGHIYSSSDTLAELQKHPKFSYRSGVIVTAVAETADKAEITAYERDTGQPMIWQSERVFLAAGAIPTTQILLRSLNAYDQTVRLKDSQYFLVPLLAFKKTSGASEEWLHSLSQIFVELSAKDTGKTAHVQIYSYNDLIGQAIASAFGPLRRPLGWVVRDLQLRVLVAQGFLHSEHSSRIAVCLRKENARDRLELRGEMNPDAKAAVRHIVRALSKNARRIGARPLSLLLKMAEPGRSFHSGGSFPMSKRPERFQTDISGRPAGWKRVHAVDATVFPSIPATTITLSVMANAHRIAWEAGG